MFQEVKEEIVSKSCMCGVNQGEMIHLWGNLQCQFVSSSTKASVRGWLCQLELTSIFWSCLGRHFQLVRAEPHLLWHQMLQYLFIGLIGLHWLPCPASSSGSRYASLSPWHSLMLMLQNSSLLSLSGQTAAIYSSGGQWLCVAEHWRWYYIFIVDLGDVKPLNCLRGEPLHRILPHTWWHICCPLWVWLFQLVWSRKENILLKVVSLKKIFVASFFVKWGHVLIFCSRGQIKTMWKGETNAMAHTEALM